MSSNVVITGANKGIGLALCKEFISRGETVYGVCRKASPELRSIKGINIIENIDVTDSAGLKALKSNLSGVNIHLLVNNAGIFLNESLGSINVESVERQVQVNAVAPLVITDSLLDNIQPGAKIALITSRMGSMADNGSGGYYGYRMSKAALNAVGVSLARDLAPRNISVGILHPGFVQTEMVNHQGDVSTEAAAKSLVTRIDELNIENTGTFWHANGDVLPW